MEDYDKAREVLEEGIESTEGKERRRIEKFLENLEADLYVEPIRNGDYIIFGHYEQDCNEENGPEPIEWKIVTEDDESMLLISRYALDQVPYNNELTEVTWETCSLRAWLNNEFINTAFTKQEQRMIKTVTLKNKDYINDTSIEHYHSYGGNDTEDRIFCLSVDEIQKYYYINKYFDENNYFYCQDLLVEATDFACTHGAYGYPITPSMYYDTGQYKPLEKIGYDSSCIDHQYCWWWLRTPGADNTGANCVDPIGRVGLVGGYVDDVNHPNTAVCPAFYLKK